MTTKTRVPALGAEGWFTLDEDAPALIGQRCDTCETYAFPRVAHGCPNPACAGTEMAEVPLSRRGKVWSYTDARYQPPSPYVVPTEKHEPFAIAAVELAEEAMVVMGQVVAGITVDDLTVGQEMELVLDVLFSDDETEHLIWKWRPIDTGPADTDRGGDR